MDIMGIVLYDLVMANSRRIPVFSRHILNVDSPLGRITHAGELTKSQIGPNMVPHRVFDRYAVVYLLEGEGHYFDVKHNKAQPIHPGDLIVVHPGRLHRYGPETGGMWHEMYLVFEGPLFDAWAQARLLDYRRPVMHLESVLTWQRRLKSVLEPEPPRNATGVLAEVCRLQLLLADALGVGEEARTVGGHNAWVAQAREALANGDDQRLIARRLHCSYDTFRRRFKQITGVSPTRFRSQQQIERACAMMRGTGLADKQIARELHFCDEFHFSRRFKQITGLSPREYRRSLL